MKYTKVNATSPLIIQTVKTRLTPSLGNIPNSLCVNSFRLTSAGKLSSHLGREVRAALEDEIPQCKGWSEIHFHPVLLRVVARVSSSIFVGTKLSKSEKYIENAINYAMDVMKGALAVNSLKPWLRPFKASRLPEVRRLRGRVEKAGEFFTPIVAKRKQQAKDPGWEKPDDLLQWLIDVQEAKYGETTPQALAKNQLDVAFAAVHTTTTVALST